MLEQFQEQEYTTHWYKKTTMLTFYLDKYGENLIKQFQTYEVNHVQSILWGASVKGKAVLDLLPEIEGKEIELINIEKIVGN